MVALDYCRRMDTLAAHRAVLREKVIQVGFRLDRLVDMLLDAEKDGAKQERLWIRCAIATLPREVRGRLEALLDARDGEAKA